MCLTREGEDGRPSVKVTQNPLTNTIFEGVNLSSKGDNITYTPAGDKSERSIATRYLVPGNNGLATCHTVQVDGLGEEGMKGLYDKLDKGEYPTCKNVSVSYNFELPDQDEASGGETFRLLGSTDSEEYDTMPSDHDDRRKGQRNCTFLPGKLIKQVKNGWEAITTGTTTASSS